MRSLQLLFRASHAALLLVLCLQLGTNTAQEDTPNRQLIMMDFQMPQVTRSTEEVAAKLTVQTELRECMVTPRVYYRHQDEPPVLHVNESTNQTPLKRTQAVLWDLQLQSVLSLKKIKIETYLVSSKPIDGSFNYKYTGCLCDDYPRTFYWDFQVNSTVRVAAVVDAVPQLGICPNDEAVIPIRANRFSYLRTLFVI